MSTRPLSWDGWLPRPYLAPRLKKESSYTSSPLWAFMASSRVAINFEVTVVWSWQIPHMPSWLAQGQAQFTRTHTHIFTVIFQTTQRRALGRLINKKYMKRGGHGPFQSAVPFVLWAGGTAMKTTWRWSCPSRYSNRAPPENKMHCRLSQVALHIRIICVDRGMRPVLCYVTYTPTTPTAGNFM
jgi:hypothetical protein